MDELEILRSENARLAALVQSRENLLHQRAEPMLAAVIDALDTVAGLAEAGHPGARVLINNWNLATKRAGAVKSPTLFIAGNGGPGLGPGPG